MSSSSQINLTWAPTWLGQVELGAVYDPMSMTEDLAGGSDGAAVDFNVDITTWQDSGWFFASSVIRSQVAGYRPVWRIPRLGFVAKQIQ